jgi:hypothetical protein
MTRRVSSPLHALARETRRVGHLVAFFAVAVASGCGGDLARDPEPAELQPFAGETRTVFVALGGDDSGDGDRTSPVRSLERAQQLVRRLRAAGPGPIEVVIDGGTYHLERPLRFGAEEGGAPDRPITYRAAPGEKVVLSGSVRAPPWEVEAGGLWRTKVKGAFRQIYVGDNPATRAYRAREPGPGQSFYVDRYDKSGGRVVAVHLRQGTPRALPPIGADAEVVLEKTWTSSVLPTVGIKAHAEGIYCALEELPGRREQALHDALDFYGYPGIRAFVQNDRALLDAPGEWFHDRASGELSYAPFPGQTPSRHPAIVPRLEALLVIAGTPERPVSHLTFAGLELRHTTWDDPTRRGYVGNQAGNYTVGNLQPGPDDLGRRPAAIVISQASDVRIVDSFIGQLGADALLLLPGTRRVQIARNYFREVAGNAISLHTFLREAREVEERIQDVEIEENLIHHVGTEFAGIGVYVTFGREIRIQRNQIRDASYSGLSVGYFMTPAPGVMGKVVIRQNDISRVLGNHDDGGGIYFLREQGATYVFHNHIHDVRSPPVPMGPDVQVGLYFDQLASGISAYLNQVSASKYGFFMGSYPGLESHDLVFTQNAFHEIGVEVQRDREAFLETAASRDIAIHNLAGENSWIVAGAGVPDPVRRAWRSRGVGYSERPLGFLRYGGGIFFNSGAAVCAFRSWGHYLSWGGREDLSNTYEIAAPPPSQGVCQEGHEGSTRR